jgi:hypothetical protein
MVPMPKRVYLLAFLLLAFPLLYSIDWNYAEWKSSTYRLTLGWPALFIFLALVPGVLAIVYHLVTVVQRRNQNHAAVDAYYTWLNARTPGRAHQKGLARVADSTPGPVSANAATILLVAVFLFVAIIAAYTDWDQGGLRGVVYAGLGAYVATLYFMISRLYASALSSRFLMASAIGTASAIVMGWVFAMIGISALGVGADSLNLSSVLFLTGLFHKWAFDALRRRARKLFGQPEPETVELPINSIEGVDDVHADLLSEYGVSTVQHLATAEPGELCERTLLPLDRISEWIDQAILVSYLNKNITAARSLGIRGAINLVLIYNQAVAETPAGPMSKLLDSLGEKITMPRASIDAIAQKLRDDYTVGLIYELREGRKLPTTVETLAPRVAQELVARYDFVSGTPSAPVMMEIKPKPAAQGS